ncbi:MAG: cytochrome P450 [Gammaproteobacteria bacterium]
MTTEGLLFDPGLAPVMAPGKPQRPTLLAPVVVSRYQDVIMLLRHRDVQTYSPVDTVKTFFKSIGRNPNALVKIIQLNPILASGEKHRYLRGLSNEIIGRMSESWSDNAIGAISRHFLNRACHHPICDAHHDITIPLSSEFAAREFDLPQNEIRTIRDMGHFLIDQAFASDVRLPAMIHLADQADIYIQEKVPLLRQAKVLQDIRDSDPNDAGLLFGLISAPFSLILSTTLTFSMVALTRLPRLANILLSRPVHINGFIKECFRLANATRWSGNTITLTEIALRDITLPANTVFRCNLERANRDPDAFSEPDLINLARAQTPHLAFGSGPHACLGSQLSWRIMRCFLTVLINEFDIIAHAPPIEVDGPNRREYTKVPVEIRRRQG